MKRIMWLVYSAATGVALAAMVQFAWQPVQSPDGAPVEYVFVMDRDPSVLTNFVKNAHTVIFCGTNTNLLVVGKFDNPPWYGVVYSVWSNVWSDPSNLVEVRAPPPATNALRVAIDVSPDMKMWTNAGFVRLRIAP